MAQTVQYNRSDLQTDLRDSRDHFVTDQ